MTLNDFAKITRSAISRDGFDQFLPTACYPARRHVTVLKGVPPNVDLQAAAVRWATDKAQANEEVLVAFRISATEFKIWRRVDGRQEDAIFGAA